ncbi:hypothetical protein MTO96_026460 [Rhipicephalus appendiculatus]
MNHIWITCSFVFTQAILASAGGFQTSNVLDGNEEYDSFVRSPVTRTGVNKRVRRGILGAAKMAKDVTTAAIRGVMVMKNKIRELKGGDSDEPFDPIDVDAILKAEGYTDDPSVWHNSEDAFVPPSTNTRFHPTNFHPRMNPYNDGHMEDMSSEEFYKGQ